MVARVMTLEEGTIFWDDVPVDKQRQEFHGSLVWLAHRTGLKGDLTLVENLGFERHLRAHSTRDKEEVYERLGIARLKKLIVRSLSAGQQRRVALARMLLADVPLWFMDEPFTNLDREGRALVLELVDEHLVAVHQHVHAGRKAVVADHRRYGCKKPHRRGNQRLGNAGGHGSQRGLTHVCQAPEGVHDAPHRSEQTDVGAGRADRREEWQVALQELHLDENLDRRVRQCEVRLVPAAGPGRWR